ncbi:MAG: calcium-binding protein [Paracoccaceae bacterium]
MPLPFFFLNSNLFTFFDALLSRIDRDQIGTDGDDGLDGTIFADTIVALGGDDAVYGGFGRDQLDGGAGEDTIDGGFGADLIRSGDGNDVTSGGKGPDRFVFAEGESDGAETILDFDVHDDQLVLDAESFGVDAPLSVQVVDRANGEDPNDIELLGIEGGNTVYVLEGVWNNAGQAADALAAALAETPEDEGAGFFVYHNINQGRNRLFQVDDLDDAASAIQHVTNLSDLGNPEAVDELPDFSEANFSFEADGLFV